MSKRNHITTTQNEANRISQSIEREDELQLKQEPQSKRIKTLMAMESNQVVDACFYEEEEINQNFNCPVCTHRFTDPRLLPCGDAICQKCLELIKETDSNDEYRFKCPICQEVSVNLDKETLPKIKILQNLVQLKPKEIYRNKNVETLKSNLNKIQSSIITIQSTLNDPILAQKKHFYSVRNDIDLAAEKAKQSIDEKRDKLLKYLENISEEYLHQPINKMYQQESEQVLENAFQFFEQKSNYLKKIKLDDSEIEKSLQLSKEHIEKLGKQSEKLDLSANKINFIATDFQLDDHFLGIITNSHFSSSIGNLGDYSNIMFNYDEEILAFEQLSTNQTLIVVYKRYDYIIKVYNTNGVLDKEVALFDERTLGYCLTKKSFVSTNLKFILISLSCNSSNGQNHDYLCLYDFQLNKICSIKLNNRVECLSMSESKCYCIMKENNMNILTLFDMNLQKIGAYGSNVNSKKEPFYFNYAIAQILVKDEKIYILKNDADGEIHVMDEKTGFILQVLPFEVHCFTMLTNDIIRFVSKQKDKICFAYKNGKILSKFYLHETFKIRTKLKLSKGSFLASKYDQVVVYN